MHRMFLFIRKRFVHFACLGILLLSTAVPQIHARTEGTASVTETAVSPSLNPEKEVTVSSAQDPDPETPLLPSPEVVFPELALALEAEPQLVQVDTVVTVTVAIENTGEALLEGHSVMVQLPAGLAYVGSDSVGVTYAPEERRVTVSAIPLQPGDVQTEYFQVEVTTSFAEPVVLRAVGGASHLQVMAQAQVELNSLSAPSPAEPGTNAILGSGDEVNEGGWTLQVNEPHVSTFSGAATYEYPITLPPGRNGLQPSVSLSYNSKRVDGIINWQTSEWVGLGWSIDTIDIVRTNVRQWEDGSGNFWLTYDNRFNLILNGSSYELQAGTGDSRYGRYYADGAPDLYIERINDCSDDGNCENNTGGSRDNLTTEYWLVKTSEGTTYRLGHNTDSEQVLFRTLNLTDDIPPSPYSGPIENYSAFRWRVDKVTDLFGNEMEYQYAEYQSQGGKRDIASYIANIKYNKQGSSWLTEIIFNGINKGSSPGDLEGPIFRTRRILNNIQIRWNSTLVSEYVLDIDDSRWLPNSGQVYLLDGITPYGYGGVAGGFALPGPSFEYTQYNNKDTCQTGWEGCDTEWDQEQFFYERLTAVNTGYGGRIEFSYQVDGGGRGDWWRGFYNYRVTEKRVYDGIQTNPVTVIDYDYGTPCYDQTGDNFPSSGGTNCPSPGAPSNGSLVGHDTVTATVLENNTPVRVTEHFFRTTGHYSLLGREEVANQFTADGTTMVQQTINTYGRNDSICQTAGLPSTANFTCLRETNTITFDPTDVNNSTATQVEYLYEPSRQDGVQYGRQTQINYKDEDDNLLRYTVSRYDASNNPDAWLVLTRLTRLHDAAGTAQSRTFYLYDDNLDPDNQVFTKGQLTLTRAQVNWTDVDPGELITYKTVDTRYAYDSYGNPKTVSTYSDYGEMGYSAGANNWSYASAPGNGSQEQTTTTTYDSNNLFPIAQTNPLGFTVETTYDSQFPWSASEITDPNGVVKAYRYDLAGRLTAVKESNPSAGIGEFTAVSYAYTLVDPPGSIDKMLQIDETTAPDDNNLRLTNRRFYDGLGRIVQDRTFDVEIDGSTNTVIWQETQYDALGQPTCQIHPGDTNTTQFYGHDCTSYANTRTLYDDLGRPLIVTGPDGSQSYSLTTGLTTLSFDAKNHVTLLETDPLGRLIKVGEMHNAYDAFAAGSFDTDTTRWTRSAALTQITELDGEDVLAVQGNGYWANWGVVRENPYTIEPGQTVFLRFQFGDEEFAGRLGLLTDKGGFIGITSHVDTLYPDYNIGGSDIGLGSVAISRKADVWYRAKIDIDTQGRVTWFVWQEDDPHNSNKHFYYTLDTAASRDFYDDASFKFYIHSGTTAGLSTVYLSDYQKGSLLTTDYQYDTLDNLIGVTDVAGNQTSIAYDALSRKTGMDDPDMGSWTYAYDPAGNLTRLTDAKGEAICYQYDALNRLTQKVQDSTPATGCLDWFPFGEDHLASYIYDSASNGIGQLHTVSWGDNSFINYDEFNYDGLGRMVKQNRLVAGRPYTMETLSFDALHRPLEVQYPSGEIVTMTYDREGKNSLMAGADSLVSDVRYNAQRQLTYVDRVHAWNLDTQFTYFGAGGNFRLQEIRNGNTTDDRPDFTYAYDVTGNITFMETATSSNGTDTQTFSYDPLNRLVTAVASGGVSDYDHTYGYDEIGNMVDNDGVTYDYFGGGDYGGPHAVTHLDGVPKFWYDANGNMTNRLEADRGYVQKFDVENRLVQVVTGATALDTEFPGVYTAPNDAPVLNNGLTSGFVDASRENSYTFTFAPGVRVSSFSLRMLDYGDYNPHLATIHTASLTAYAANGTLLAEDSFSYETLPETPVRSGTYLSPNPGTPVGDLFYTGDAVSAAPGEPGNYTFSVSSPGITRLELAFSNDVTGVGSSDPNIAFTDLCFTIRATSGEVCLDFSQVEPGDSIEGLGVVDPNLNISTGTGGGETTRFAYDASGQRVLTIEPDGTEIYYPFAGYEEEIAAGVGTQTAVPGGSNVATAVASAPLSQTNSQQLSDSIPFIFQAFILGSAALVLVAFGMTRAGGVSSRTPLRKRRRVWAARLVMLVSLGGILITCLLGLTPAQAMPALGPVQSPWANADIGAITPAGSADETAGVFTVDGAGGDIGGSVDGFHYVYQPLAGDGSITAQVTSQTTPNFWSKAGIMIRQDLSDQAPHVAAMVASQANRVYTLQRSSSGGSTSQFTGGTGNVPIWLRLERAGGTITSYRSADGVNWTQLESLSTSMNGSIYVGLAVTSRLSGQLSTATFEAVSVTGGSGGPCNVAPHDLATSSRLELEDFRCGDEGVAFHEELTSDNGPGSGGYRSDVTTEGPDLDTTNDVGGGYYLGWTRTGEWLEYEIIAPEAGAYDFTVRYASDTGNTPAFRLTATQEGTPVSDSGVINLADTGGWQSWVDHQVSLDLAQGTNIVRLTIEAGYSNYNYVDIEPAAPSGSEVITQRTTYSIAGQAVFLRLRTLEDGMQTTNKLYALHSDHLGSTSTLSYLDPAAGTAYQLQDARAVYEPFGDYRVEPTGEYTDRGFTGHIGNNSGSNDIGLIYMNARYYVPSISRFASADTIVPNSTYPQSFNRYAYVYNNPLALIDPSGHCPSKEACLEGGDAITGGSDYGNWSGVDIDAIIAAYNSSVAKEATGNGLDDFLVFPGGIKSSISYQPYGLAPGITAEYEWFSWDNGWQGIDEGVSVGVEAGATFRKRNYLLWAIKKIAIQFDERARYLPIGGGIRPFVDIDGTAWLTPGELQGVDWNSLSGLNNLIATEYQIRVGKGLFTGNGSATAGIYASTGYTNVAGDGTIGVNASGSVGPLTVTPLDVDIGLPHFVISPEAQAAEEGFMNRVAVTTFLTRYKNGTNYAGGGRSDPLVK